MRSANVHNEGNLNRDVKKPASTLRNSITNFMGFFSKLSWSERLHLMDSFFLHIKIHPPALKKLILMSKNSFCKTSAFLLLFLIATLGVISYENETTHSSSPDKVDFILASMRARKRSWEKIKLMSTFYKQIEIVLCICFIIACIMAPIIFCINCRRRACYFLNIKCVLIASYRPTSTI